jgi:hypothetical protein
LWSACLREMPEGVEADASRAIETNIDYRPEPMFCA